MLVVYEIEARGALRLARWYRQVAVVHVQRVPYEDLVLLNVRNEQRVRVRRYDPAAIADALARMFGTAAVAVECVPVGWFESLASAMGGEVDDQCQFVVTFCADGASLPI